LPDVSTQVSNTFTVCMPASFITKESLLTRRPMERQAPS
jgi:hypothetical protein